MATADYYMRLPYKEVIEPADEGGYVAYLPDLPGCITQGETKDRHSENTRRQLLQHL